MLLTLLFLATCFLAYANGANDNFKGVASLYGSGTASYRTALGWATITTFAGSCSAIFLAQSLLKKFSGKGLVPDELVGSEQFLLAVVVGASLTVIMATIAGLPVSTTHGLTGSLVGAGCVAARSEVNLAALQKSFLLPLILGPLLAIGLGAALYYLLHQLRIKLRVGKEWCVCVGREQRVLATPRPAANLERHTALPEISVMVGDAEKCEERYAGTLSGFKAQGIMDSAHFLSGGIVCFARGLNDTPKIAAMLLLFKAFDMRWGIVCVALMMVVGGLIHSAKIAETMSRKITGMNHGQGLSANLSTGILVILASVFGLPVSTTHVSVGSLFGIGLSTGRANPKVMLGILLAWGITLPCAAILSGLAYWVIRNAF